MNNDIVVEMKTDKANEEAGLLNKRPPTEQVRLMDAGSEAFRVKDLNSDEVIPSLQRVTLSVTLSKLSNESYCKLSSSGCSTHFSIHEYVS